MAAGGPSKDVETARHRSTPPVQSQGIGSLGGEIIATLCLLACVLILVTGANGQENLNFATRIPRGLSGRNLPLVNMPSPVPNGYGQLNWGSDFNLNQCVFGVPAFQGGDDGGRYSFVRKWGKQAPAGTFNFPDNPTVDPKGNVFVFDLFKLSRREIRQDG